MLKKELIARCAVAAAGTMILAGVAGVAVAAEQDDEAIDVTVQIAEIEEPGVLALSVAGGSVALAESGSTSLVRQFTGTLPQVTVTDTRDPEDIPEGAYWYVVGSASSFVGSAGQPAIGADHLGWTPELLDGGESGLVAEGDPVQTVLDQGADNVGLVDQELLAMAADSSAVNGEGQWTASADLFLRTPVDVAPGAYASVLTLSLFE
jgi:hypothetical protein